MPAPVISLRSVVALIDRFPVLAGVDFDVAAGEVILLRGSNGAGKTSLLRLVAGLLSIDQGEATVLGRDLRNDRQAIRRHVGLLGHNSTLYEELTVGENLRFATKAAKSPADRVDIALEKCGLQGRLADVAVQRLSAGQRRRAALACLVARDPELWLLDEPHAGLDAASRVQLDGLISDAAERGRTVLFSSHETERGELLASRAVTLEGGYIVPSAVALDGSETKAPTYVS